MMFVTKRKLNKKLDLLIFRQNLLATVIFAANFDHDQRKKLEKKWNKVWYDVMEVKNG